MQRTRRNHRLLVLAIAALGVGVSVTTHAQDVVPPSAPASCAQHAANGNLACGSGSVANPGTGSMAFGINATATADGAMAFGFNTAAGSISAMAFGLNTSASNQGSVAFGQGAVSSGFAATAVGFAARAFGTDSVAVGNTATAGAGAGVDFGTALGSNTRAEFTASTAIGSGAQTTAANQMMFGTAGNTYTAPGINSPASKAAQKGRLRIVTVDADGNLASAPMPICRCPRPGITPRRSTVR
jgi:trimeric autotransporter adhesin